MLLDVLRAVGVSPLRERFSGLMWGLAAIRKLVYIHCSHPTRKSC